MYSEERKKTKRNRKFNDNGFPSFKNWKRIYVICTLVLICVDDIEIWISLDVPLWYLGCVCILCGQVLLRIKSSIDASVICKPRILHRLHAIVSCYPLCTATLHSLAFKQMNKATTIKMIRSDRMLSLSSILLAVTLECTWCRNKKKLSNNQALRHISQTDKIIAILILIPKQHTRTHTQRQ